jgi:hypothetical protein
MPSGSSSSRARRGAEAMILALAATAVVMLALVGDLVAPDLLRRWQRFVNGRRRAPELSFDDPGRERRAEARARELLRSCLGEEEWAMYRELGFVRVWGAAENAYLIYPHKPIVSYVPATGRLLHEYCVAFPDETRPYGSSRLPDSDDVLAKWMALTGDEERLLASSNMHLAGRQHDARRVAADVWRLSRWERARLGDTPPLNA